MNNVLTKEDINTLSNYFRVAHGNKFRNLSWTYRSKNDVENPKISIDLSIDGLSNNIELHCLLSEAEEFVISATQLTIQLAELTEGPTLNPFDYISFGVNEIYEDHGCNPKHSTRFVMDISMGVDPFVGNLFSSFVRTSGTITLEDIVRGIDDSNKIQLEVSYPEFCLTEDTSGVGLTPYISEELKEGAQRYDLLTFLNNHKRITIFTKLFEKFTVDSYAVSEDEVEDYSARIQEALNLCSHFTCIEHKPARNTAAGMLGHRLTFVMQPEEYLTKLKEIFNV